MVPSHPKNAIILPNKNDKKGETHPPSIPTIPIRQEAQVELPPVAGQKNPQHQHNETPGPNEAWGPSEESAEGQDHLHVKHEAIGGPQQPQWGMVQVP